MHLWHLTPDMPRDPRRGSAGDWVSVELGTSPIESGQTVWLTLRADGASGATRESRVASVWQRNDGINSYWHAEIGPFADGDSVRYAAHGSGPASAVDGPKGEFRVGPKRYLAILSHQHQPLYRDLAAPSPRGGYGQPWVRLHAIRDYYSMSHLVAQHPAIRLTINLTPVLLEQILEYVDHGATDAAVDLTRTLAGRLTPTASEIVLATFFDAHWHNQIFPHARYKELFTHRADSRPFSTQDVRDLQMWFNLAWFAKEFRDGEVTLATGEVASVRRFVVQERGFADDDISAMVGEQMKILRAIIPIHRQLQGEGSSRSPRPRSITRSCRCFSTRTAPSSIGPGQPSGTNRAPRRICCREEEHVVAIDPAEPARPENYRRRPARCGRAASEPWRREPGRRTVARVR